VRTSLDSLPPIVEGDNDLQLLDVVVLDRDLPEHNLRRGDLGTIVHLHDANAMDVEFLNASGGTQALVTALGAAAGRWEARRPTSTVESSGEDRIITPGVIST
jgi:hypothetical protein